MRDVNLTGKRKNKEYYDHINRRSFSPINYYFSQNNYSIIIISLHRIMSRTNFAARPLFLSIRCLSYILSLSFFQF